MGPDDETLYLAAQTVPVKDKMPDVPWAKITGLRNRFAHDDRDTQMLIVWEAVSRDMPPLLDSCCLSGSSVSRASSRVAAYLVLVAGAAQVGLGVGQALLAPGPLSARLVAIEVAVWNLGNAAVLVAALWSDPSSVRRLPEQWSRRTLSCTTPGGVR